MLDYDCAAGAVLKPHGPTPDGKIRQLRQIHIHEYHDASRNTHTNWDLIEFEGELLGSRADFTPATSVTRYIPG